jgi:hypothetical protein
VSEPCGSNTIDFAHVEQLISATCKAPTIGAFGTLEVGPERNRLFVREYTFRDEDWQERPLPVWQR